MTPHEEIEYICNAAYLRGCDSNFKTAIAGMQESEKFRLAAEAVYVTDDGRVRSYGDILLGEAYEQAFVFGARGSMTADTAGYSLLPKERYRLAELVKLIKSRREAASA